MKNNISKPPIPICEPVKSYAPGTIEREQIKIEYNKYINQIIEIPMFINGKNIKSRKIKKICPPHNHKNVVAKYYEGNSEHVKADINAALKAKRAWEETN